MALSPRFSLDTLAVIGGGFLAVSAMSFSAATAGWIGFGVSALFTVAAATGATLARRASARAGHSALAVVALWSLIAALSFSGSALTWLVFADALALATAALADLTAHEVGTEHVVHSLDVRPAAEAAHAVPAADDFAPGRARPTGPGPLTAEAPALVSLHGRRQPHEPTLDA